MFLPKQHLLVSPYASNITQDDVLSRKPLTPTMPYPSIWKTERLCLPFFWSKWTWSTVHLQLKHSGLQWGKVAGVWRLLTHPRIATEMESVWRSDAWQEEGRGGRDGHNVPRFKGAGGKLMLIRSDVQELVRFWEPHLFTSPRTERALCALRRLKQWAFVRGRQGTWVNLVTARLFTCHRDREETDMEMEIKMVHPSVFWFKTVSACNVRFCRRLAIHISDKNMHMCEGEWEESSDCEWEDERLCC